MSNRTSQQPLLVDDAIFFSGDKLCIPTHRPIRILGQGKNGFVVLCHNEILNRPEALKVWAKRDSDDSRDKFKQGLEEARKAVAASQGRFVAQIYAAGVLLERYLYATTPDRAELAIQDQADRGRGAQQLADEETVGSSFHRGRFQIEISWLT
jgi:serine/threonine protein kinase